MSKKRPRQCYIYTRSGCTIYRLAWVLLIIRDGQFPEPQLNNSKVPTPSFCYNPCHGSGWGDNLFVMEENIYHEQKADNEDCYCLFKLMDNYSGVYNKKMSEYGNQSYAYVRYVKNNGDKVAFLAYFDVIEKDSDFTLSNITIINNKEKNCVNKVEVHYVFYAYALSDASDIYKTPEYTDFPFKKVITSKDKYPYRCFETIKTMIDKEIEKKVLDELR